MNKGHLKDNWGYKEFKKTIEWRANKIQDNMRTEMRTFQRENKR